MKIVFRLEEIPPLKKPIALTIGTFDGLHLGHQTILERLRGLTEKEGSRCVLTFSNHPQSVLSPREPISLLSTIEHKLFLLENSNVDLVILCPFTEKFAKQSYEEFIQNLRSHLPFSNLILGKEAAFGKNREGTCEKLFNLGQKEGFNVEYLTKVCSDGKPISSGRIRSLIHERNLDKVEKLLGRPFAIFTPFAPSQVEEKEGNILKISFSFKQICLPPQGVYKLYLTSEKEHIPCIASISDEIFDIYFKKQNLTPSFLHLTFQKFLEDAFHFEKVGVYLT